MPSMALSGRRENVGAYMSTHMALLCSSSIHTSFGLQTAARQAKRVGWRRRRRRLTPLGVGVAGEPLLVIGQGHEHVVVEVDEEAGLESEQKRVAHTEDQEKVADARGDGSNPLEQDTDRQRRVLSQSQLQKTERRTDQGQHEHVDKEKSRRSVGHSDGGKVPEVAGMDRGTDEQHPLIPSSGAELAPRAVLQLQLDSFYLGRPDIGTLGSWGPALLVQIVEVLAVHRFRLRRVGLRPPILLCAPPEHVHEEFHLLRLADQRGMVPRLGKEHLNIDGEWQMDQPF